MASKCSKNIGTDVNTCFWFSE